METRPLYVSHPAEAQACPPTLGVEEAAPPDTRATRKLEQARAADAAWRAERSAAHQQRIDRAHAREREGRRWTLVGGQLLLTGWLLYVFAFFVLNSAPDSGAMRTAVARLGDWLGPLFLGYLVLGLYQYVTGRVYRRVLLRAARRAHTEVVDPDNVPLFDPYEFHPPETTNSQGGAPPMPLHSHPSEQPSAAARVVETPCGSVNTASGQELEQARAADAAWRAERSAAHQQRIDRAHTLELRGREWALTSERGLFLIGVILGLVSPFIFLLFVWGWGFNLLALLWTAVAIFLLVSARVLIGLSLLGLGRLERRHRVRIAQRASIQVADPGDLPAIQIRQLLPPP